MTDCAPFVGITANPSTLSSETPDGASPLPLSPNTLRSFADQVRIMVSPPSPPIIGSTTAIMPAIATAASTALPPSCSTRNPTWVAGGELDDTTQCPVMTGERRAR